MNRHSERGFSIIELLVVCVIAGLIAAIAVPYLQKAIRAAENGNLFATMRAISSTQMSFYSQNDRFGTLAEVNNILSGGIGSQVGDDIHRGKFVFSMASSSPADLRDGFIITATRNVDGEGVIYQYELTEAGEIKQILPAPDPPIS